MTTTSDQVSALLETLEDLRAADFPDVDADLVAQIVMVYADQGIEAAAKMKQLQEKLVAAIGEQSDASTD